MRVCTVKHKSVLTGNELVSTSDNSISSDFSSDNEIDDVAVTDVIINDDSDEEKETCKTFLWESMDIYSGHRIVFCRLEIEPVCCIHSMNSKRHS